MEINLYIYDLSNIISNPILIDKIKDHTNSYKNDNKRIISESNYYYLSNVLIDYGNDINNIQFIDRKPIIKDLFISMAHSNKYFGFSISKTNENGLDIEELIDESRQERLAKKILNEKLYNDYLKSDNKLYYITKMWTEFESAGKISGKGIDFKFNHEDLIYKSFSIDNTIFTVASKDDYKLIVFLNGKLRGEI